MSNPKSSIGDRYSAVTEYRSGVKLWRLSQKYRIGTFTIKLLSRRYDMYGIDGLKYLKSPNYSDSYILSAIKEYESKGLSLREASERFSVHPGTLKRWLVKYKKYKAGDKFAFNGGRVYANAIGGAQTTNMETKPIEMQETPERKRRREALSKLSKKELYELLLDREAEIELIKKAEALVKERESRLRATWRKSSKN